MVFCLFIDIEKEPWEIEEEALEEAKKKDVGNLPVEVQEKKVRLQQLIKQRFQVLKSNEAGSFGVGGGRAVPQTSRNKQGNRVSKKPSKRKLEKQQIFAQRSWKKDKCMVIVGK